MVVELWPRYVQVLARLASQPGEVISKTALLDEFWGDVAVTDNTIEQAIGAIRKAIDVDPSRPSLIQTVKRKGYRFTGAVDESGAPPQQRALDEWNKGRLSLEALNADQLCETTTAFEGMVAEHSDYAGAHAALANAYFLQYELTRPENRPRRALLDSAIACARQACVLDPSLAEAWATLGLLLTSAGDVEPARAAARHATFLRRSHWRHEFRLAVACWGDERLEVAERTLRLVPEFATAYFLKAMVFVARRAFGVAEELAANGAMRQSYDARRDSPFPAFGLHWLCGLLHLQSGEVAKALASFEREASESRRTSIYFREYRVNALIGAGYAHLAAGDPPAAAAAFRSALALLPANGRALVGLSQALAQSGDVAEAQTVESRLAETLGELRDGGRWAEAALIGAAAKAASDPAGASAMLERLLENAPPGQTGWIIPLDPALAPLRAHPSFEPVLALLSARAM